MWFSFNNAFALVRKIGFSAFVIVLQIKDLLINNLDVCLFIIEKIENRSYRGKLRVIIYVDDIVQLSDSFFKLDAEEQNIIKECITEKVGRYLISFTGVLLKKAIETSEPEWIDKALLMHILEDISFDYRENLRELSLLAPALKKCNLSIEESWDRVIDFASERIKKYLIVKAY